MSAPNDAEVPALKFGKVTRIILFVRDIDAALNFYTEVLGIPLQYRFGDWAGLVTEGVEICLHGGRTADAPPHGDPSISFRVDDFDGACSALKTRGVKLGEIFSPRPGLRVAHFDDLDGNELGIEGN